MILLFSSFQRSRHKLFRNDGQVNLYGNCRVKAGIDVVEVLQLKPSAVIASCVYIMIVSVIAGFATARLFSVEPELAINSIGPLLRYLTYITSIKTIFFVYIDIGF